MLVSGTLPLLICPRTVSYQVFCVLFNRYNHICTVSNCFGNISRQKESWSNMEFHFHPFTLTMDTAGSEHKPFKNSSYFHAKMKYI